MFGYVKPVGLKKEEQIEFDTYYCSICKAMKRYANTSRLFLSYDCTFLCMLLSEMLMEPVDKTVEMCLFRKKNIVYNSIVEFCADLNLLLVYYKLLDDVNDDNSNRAKLLIAMHKSPFEKVRKNNPDLDILVKSNLDYLYTLESHNCDEVEEVANAFGTLLKEIVALKCKQESLLDFSFNLGKYIYILDAIMDYEKDMKKGEYNCLYTKYGKSDHIVQEIRFTLEYTLSSLSDSFEKLTNAKDNPILRNIVYSGLMQYFNFEEKK